MIQKEELQYIDIEKIQISPFQPRRHFSTSELEDLAASIIAVGIIHPPVVRPSTLKDTFELVSGERRLRAAKLAGLNNIPVLVRHQHHSHAAETALIENIQRADLNPIEIAKALQSLIEQFNLNQEELARRIGKKRSTVANYLRLLTLPQNLQNSVLQGIITMGHAKAILSLETPKEQNALYERILQEDLTVRATEKAVQKSVDPETQKNQTITPSINDPHLEHIAQLLREKLGTGVTIQGKGGQGSIRIDYYSLDDLDRFLNSIGVVID